MEAVRFWVQGQKAMPTFFSSFSMLAFLLVFLLASSPLESAEIQKYVTTDGVTIISVTGDIELQDDEKFTEITSDIHQGIVTLSSDGGALLPALTIGRTIRAKGLFTIVPDHSICASACAIIWLGGNERLVSSSAQIGFHAAYRQRFGITTESGSANALVGSYYASLGLSDEAIYYLTSSAPSDMFWIDAEKARSLGIEISIIPSETPANDVPEKPSGLGYWLLRLPSSLIDGLIP